jgi:hypothetical protein
MNATDLLDRLSQYADDELCSLRHSRILDKFPTDPLVYTKIAQDFFANCNDDWQRRNRIVSIFREFLYHDGRSFEALLLIAARALSEPVYGHDGINALAGIWCYLNLNQPAPVRDEELLARFRKYANNTELQINARNCCQLILRRRPDLADDSEK